MLSRLNQLPVLWVMSRNMHVVKKSPSLKMTCLLSRWTVSFSSDLSA